MSSDREQAKRAASSARADIEHIRAWSDGRTLAELQSETLVRYGIERAFIAIDAALRDIPADLIAKHSLPARVIADFRNVLAHAYEGVLDTRIISTIRDDLPLLDHQLAAILADLEAAT